MEMVFSYIVAFGGITVFAVLSRTCVERVQWILVLCFLLTAVCFRRTRPEYVFFALYFWGVIGSLIQITDSVRKIYRKPKYECVSKGYGTQKYQHIYPWMHIFLICIGLVVFLYSLMGLGVVPPIETIMVFPYLPLNYEHAYFCP